MEEQQAQHMYKDKFATMTTIIVWHCSHGSKLVYNYVAIEYKLGAMNRPVQYD